MGYLKITGGMWNGRKIKVESTKELRPTTSRLRESLFNILGQDLSGLKCLDLYSGTGILGIEAASRGASSVQFVDISSSILTALVSNIQQFKFDGFSVTRKDIRSLKDDGNKYDLIFADPPYDHNIDAIFPVIADKLKHMGLLYYEHHESRSYVLPSSLLLLRSIHIGSAIGSILRLKNDNDSIMQE